MNTIDTDQNETIDSYYDKEKIFLLKSIILKNQEQ